MFAFAKKDGGGGGPTGKADKMVEGKKAEEKNVERKREKKLLGSLQMKSRKIKCN